MKKIIAMLVALTLLAGCNNAPQKETPKALEKITLLLDWTPNTNHTGLFVAKEKGYYKDAGLDVALVSADGGNGLEMLTGGKGDFAISFQEQITAARAAEKPLPVKAVATILQSNTSGFASLKSKKIIMAKDYEGKTYGSWGTEIETGFLKSVMQKNGADFTKIKMVTTNALDSLTLIQKDADFAWIYYGWDGIMAEQKGIELNFQLLKELDPDIEFYSPLIATSDETLKNKPEQVKKFLKATQKGYEFAYKEPKVAAEILGAANKELDVPMLIASQQYLKDYLVNTDGHWGVMQDSVWKNFTEWLLKNQIIKKKPMVSDLYTNVYLK